MNKWGSHSLYYLIHVFFFFLEVTHVIFYSLTNIPHMDFIWVGQQKEKKSNYWYLSVCASVEVFPFCVCVCVWTTCTSIESFCCAIMDRMSVRGKDILNSAESQTGKTNALLSVNFMMIHKEETQCAGKQKQNNFSTNIKCDSLVHKRDLSVALGQS